MYTLANGHHYDNVRIRWRKGEEHEGVCMAIYGHFSPKPPHRGVVKCPNNYTQTQNIGSFESKYTLFPVSQ